MEMGILRITASELNNEIMRRFTDNLKVSRERRNHSSVKVVWVSLRNNGRELPELVTVVLGPNQR